LLPFSELQSSLSGSYLQAFEEITGFKVHQNRTAILPTTHEVQTERNSSVVLVDFSEQRRRWEKRKEESESAGNKTPDCDQTHSEDHFMPVLRWQPVEKSLYHSLTSKKANEKRTLVITPDFAQRRGTRL
jgi:hypothetical protein